MKHYAEEQGIL